MIAGIDFDTHSIAMVKVPNEPGKIMADCAVVNFRGKSDAFEAPRHLHSELYYHPFWVGVDMVWIEHGFGASRKSDWLLGRVQGAIIASLPEWIAVGECHVAEWKKHIGVAGNAKKDVTHDRIRELGFTHEDGNIMDAWAIAITCRDLAIRAAGRGM